MITPKKKRCHACNAKVFENTLRGFNGPMVCVECYVKCSLKKKGSKRTGHRSKKDVPMFKYGTAEKVQKKDGKAVISEKKLTASEVADAVAETKTADSKLPKKKIVVTDDGYKQE